MGLSFISCLIRPALSMTNVTSLYAFMPVISFGTTVSYLVHTSCNSAVVPVRNSQFGTVVRPASRSKARMYTVPAWQGVRGDRDQLHVLAGSEHGTGRLAPAFDGQAIAAHGVEERQQYHLAAQRAQAGRPP